MKRKIVILFLALLPFIVTGLTVSAQATGHSAVLTWSPPTDVIPGETYNVYRTANACPATTATFAKINSSPVTTPTYTDSTITAGSWCYQITAVQNGVESAPSVSSGGNAKPNTVTITTVIVN